MPNEKAKGTQQQRTSGGDPAPGKTLLIADDDPLVLAAVSELLRKKNYVVHTARNGLEALETIRKVKPDYVILDIIMPKLDGSRVCSLIRQDPDLRNTPVIAFSSLSAKDISQFPELSADAYVAKGELPVAFRHLLEAIAHIDTRDSGDLSGGVFGFDRVRPRQLVEELLRERRRYATVLQSLGDGVIELDRSGRILSATPGACDMLGKREAKAVGEEFVSFCSSHDRRTVQDLLADMLEAKRPGRWRATVRLVGGTQIAARFCAPADEKHAVGALIIMDVTGTSKA